ncbi:4149_t:CDS:2, partial [Acaulospora colombiana]
DRTPSGGEKGNVDADESDEAFLAGKIFDRDGDTDDGDEVFADEHADGTDEQETSTSDVVDGPKGGDGHDDVDDVGGDRDRERVADTRVLEEGRAVVKDEIDTGELLPGLDKDTGEGAEEDLVGAHLEAVHVRALADFFFHAQVGLDVLEFGLDVNVVGGGTEETGERTGGGVVLVFLDEESRRFGEEEHADGEDTGPDELESDGDAVRAGVVTVLACLVDDGSEEETDSLNGDDGTTNPLGRRLGLVHGNETRDLTDTETSKDTTGDKEGDGSGSGLHGYTSRKDDTAGDDGQPSAHDIGHGCGAERTKECSQGEDGDDEGFVGRRDGVPSLAVGVSERLEPELQGILHNVSSNCKMSKIYTHPPNAAKQTIPIPRIEDLRPPSIPDETTAAPPPGIVVVAGFRGGDSGEKWDEGWENGNNDAQPALSGSTRDSTSGSQKWGHLGGDELKHEDENFCGDFSLERSCNIEPGYSRVEFLLLIKKHTHLSVDFKAPATTILASRSSVSHRMGPLAGLSV